MSNRITVFIKLALPKLPPLVGQPDFHRNEVGTPGRTSLHSHGTWGVPRGGHEPVDQSKRVSRGTHWVCPQVTVFSLARLNTWARSLNLQLATGLARVAQVFAGWNKEPKAGPTIHFCS